MIYPGVFFFFSPKFWFYGVLEELKSKKWFKMTKSYVCCAPQPSFFLYLRNHLCGYNFWCTFVKWWYLQVFFFSFFQNFDFSCYRGKGQKMAENGKKLCLSHSISQEPYIIWSSFMKNKCKMIISPRYFFHFFKTLIFLVVLTVKGQKMAQNEKKLCPSLFISQEPSIIWS